MDVRSASFKFFLPLVFCGISSNYLPAEEMTSLSLIQSTWCRYRRNRPRSEVTPSATGTRHRHSNFPAYCTVSGARVMELTKVPDEPTPFTVMAYDPAGVPGVGVLAPQAAWKTTLANSTQAKAAAVNFPSLFCCGPKRRSAHQSGPRQSRVNAAPVRGHDCPFRTGRSTGVPLEFNWTGNSHRRRHLQRLLKKYRRCDGVRLVVHFFALVGGACG